MLPLPLRGLRGWGVRFSEFASGILQGEGSKISPPSLARVAGLGG